MACDADTSRAPRPRVRPSESKTEPVGVRRTTPRVVIDSPGRIGTLLRTAVSDLKSVGVWRPLARRLYEIKLDSRSGSINAPRDGHLADAYFTGVVDARGSGLVCDVMFFPAAVAGDLARWRRYYRGGLITDPPPTVRAFYGSLLAHELAHCRRGARGEAVARAWETRALRLLREAGI